MTHSKRKFVLVDQSISELGGHHYEYAVRVLTAAREDGLDARLVTNKRLSPSLAPDFPVLPIYEFGYWDRPLRLGPWVIRSFPPPGSIKAVRRAAYAAYLGIATIGQRLSGRASTERRRSNGLDLEVNRREPFSGQRASVREFVRPLVTALRSAAGGAQFFGLNAAKIRQFERDTLDMIAALGLRADDIVFVPTLSEAELLGLGRAIASCRPDDRIGWHLLFRRPPVPARAAYARSADARRAQVRKCLATFAQATVGHRVRFHTDTEALTQQYNDLGVVRFDTLPIPVPSSFGHSRDPERASAVPTILFAGDARVEKGFQLLPILVEQLKRESPAGLSPRFIIQSNFSVPGGEPVAARARRELRSHAKNGVRLIDEPLQPDAYCAIFHASDISLIPYDPLEYRTRSSGVFAESVAAGLVTIVPSGTWMAAQLGPRIAAYHHSLLCGSRHLETSPGASIEMRDGSHAGSLDVPASDGADHLIVAMRAAHINDEMEPLVSLEWLQPNRMLAHRDRGVAARSDSGHWTCMFRLRTSPLRARLVVTSRAPRSSIGLRIEHFAFISAGHPLPLSAAGIVYQDEACFPAAVREVLCHRSHYIRTAAVFSSEWTGRHTPEQLEQELARQLDSARG
jgi:hypothetical protein